jgi:acetyltransferase
MINAGKGLSLPPVKGNKLAVFSRSGGHAIVSVDVANELGFELPDFPGELIEIAKPFFRVNVIDRQNPLDLGTVFNFDFYPIIIEETIKLIHPDAVLLIFNYRR